LAEKIDTSYIVENKHTHLTDRILVQTLLFAKRHGKLDEWLIDVEELESEG